MGAPKGNNYAKGNNGGNPGYGKMAFIKAKVEQYSELWWKEWEEMMTSEAMDHKKFAMTEFNKLQTKMIPQSLAGDPDNPIFSIGDILNKLNADNSGATEK